MSTTADADQTPGPHPRMWAAVAAGWDAPRRLRRVARRARDRGDARADGAAAGRAGARAGQRRGRRRPGGRAAGRPGGEVVVSDVAAEMVEIAGRRARPSAVSRTSCRACSASRRSTTADASYDVVLCREGLMFAVQPELAAREIARVLRPGGRAAVAVWGPQERNPWLGCVFEALGRAARSGRCRRPASPARSPSPTPAGSSSCWPAELDEVDVEEVAVPLDGGVVRRVVEPHVGPGRAAVDILDGLSGEAAARAPRPAGGGRPSVRHRRRRPALPRRVAARLGQARGLSRTVWLVSSPARSARPARPWPPASGRGSARTRRPGRRSSWRSSCASAGIRIRIAG